MEKNGLSKRDKIKKDIFEKLVNEIEKLNSDAKFDEWYENAEFNIKLYYNRLMPNFRKIEFNNDFTETSANFSEEGSLEIYCDVGKYKDKDTLNQCKDFLLKIINSI